MQDPTGFWVAELEADSTLTSEYIMLRYLLGKVDKTKQRKAAAYLLDTQLPDGGWNLYHGGSSHLSTTVKAYFALKFGDFIFKHGINLQFTIYNLQLMFQ